LRSLTPLTGKGLIDAKGDNPNALYALPTTSTPLINEKAKLNPVELKKTYLYDLQTVPGASYEISAL